MNPYAIALQALENEVPAHCIRKDAPILEKSGLDSSRIRQNPSAVLLPERHSELAAILKTANRFKVPVTVRGSGSSTTGSSTPEKDAWAVDLSGWKALEIDDIRGFARAETGVLTGVLNDRAESLGWFYPPDPSSKAYCTIGGNIATNAGGLRGAKYGVTRDYVVALEGYLPTGEWIQMGRPLRKFASGYNMRDLWIGSEGTLGIITAATLRLLHKPPSRYTCVAAFATESDSIAVIHEILRQKILTSALEFLDRQTVHSAELFNKESFIKGAEGHSLLLVELDGEADQVSKLKSRLHSVLSKAVALEHAEDAKAAERFWGFRRKCSQSMFQFGDTKLNEDVVVPLSRYQDLIELTLKLKDQTGLATPTFGHAADGNFHVHFMFDHASEEQCNKAEEGVNALMQAVVEMGGAVSGEHGIGIAKSSFLSLQHSSVEIEMMKKIKNCFDPNNILNPGKIFTAVQPWRLERDYQWTFPWDHRKH